MAADEEKNGDFYAVLGLKKECSDVELRNAYKKLAMRWHPDKCSASGNAKRMEEAKEKFQEIQKAYSVLSDSNKRFLYDVGVYDNDDDDDENGMGEFLGEMAQLMSQNKPNEDGQDSFGELQRLFVEMFQDNLDTAGFGGPFPSFPGAGAHTTDGHDRPASSASEAPPFFDGEWTNGGSNKRGNSAMNSGKSKPDDELDPGFGGSCHLNGQSSRGGEGGMNSKRRHGRKQKVSSRHDVSSCDAEI